MTSRQEGRARIVIVSSDAADTLVDCLDGVAALDLDGTDVVVVDLDSGDGSADVAIRHPVPDRVVVVRPGDADRALDAASVDLGSRPIVVLPADRRPSPGWLDAALTALEGAWVVLGADSNIGHLAVDRVRLQHVALLADVNDPNELTRRVRAAGGEVAVAEGMQTEPARRVAQAGLPPLPLPPTPRQPAALAREAGLLSVILCTKGRPDQLARCLTSLAALDDPCHEVVVIDNHDRPTLALDDLGGQVRLVHEPRRGLDVARNRGVVEARGEIVAFIDDDCEADPNWLDGLRTAFADAQVDVVTGRVRPASLGAPAQRWFEAQFSFDRGTTARRFTPWDRRLWYPLWTGGIGTGCNMAFRRSAISDIGGFDEILDMGTSIGGGGDLDAFARLLDRGAVIQYNPAALVWHHHRATEATVRRQFWGYGNSVGALLAKTMIERPGLRVVAARFFVDRLRVGARTARQSRAGSNVLPVGLVLVDLVGQCVGVIAYLLARRRTTGRT